MNINIVALALLAVTGLPTSGFAAMMPDAATPQAFIYSRDASSRFLAVSYRPGQQLSDDGLPWASTLAPNRSADPAPGPGAETSQSGLAAPQTSPRSGASLADEFDNASRFAISEQNSIAHSVEANGGSFDALTPVPHLNTVPLPASSALFGAALLILAGLGHGLRRRAPKQA